MTYGLKSPGGWIIQGLVGGSRREAWVRAYHYIAGLDPAWGEKFWKNWDGSLRSARRMGWRIVKVVLVETK